ncbi:hypothetical protein LLH00_00500 [bacterium]|nr:hypothetical protein [bacterium]
MLLLLCLPAGVQLLNAGNESSPEEKQDQRLVFESLIRQGLECGYLDSAYTVEYRLADSRPLPPRAQMAREYWYEVPEDRTGILIDSLLDLAQEIYPPESEALIPWFNLKAESLINRKKIAASETYMWQVEYNGAARLLDRALWIINNYKVADTHPAVLRLRLNKAYCNYLKGDFSGPLRSLEPLEQYFVNLPLSETATKAMYNELIARCSLRLGQNSLAYAYNVNTAIGPEEYNEYLSNIDSTTQ